MAGKDNPETSASAATGASPAAKLSPEPQEAQRLAGGATATVRAGIAAGRISEADAAPLFAAPLFAAPLFAAKTAARTAKGNARAYPAAASCLIAGRLGL